MERQEMGRELSPPPYKWRNIAMVLLIVGIVVGCVDSGIFISLT